MEAYDQIGKVGIGDIDFSSDGFLWVMSLGDQTLYRVNVGPDGSNVPGMADVTAYPTPNPGCIDGQWRPFSVKVDESSGRVLIGGVCSNEGITPYPTEPPMPEDANFTPFPNLDAYVYEFDMVTGGFNTTPIVSVPLDYPKGCAVYANDGPMMRQSGCQWFPWTDSTDPQFTSPTSTPGRVRFTHPQPILADIEILPDGDLTLNFLDRAGALAGVESPDATCTGQWFEAVTSGDLLRVDFDGTNYTLESNGSVATPGAGGGVGNGDGPGGGEFYQRCFSPPPAGNLSHCDLASGGSAYLPGENNMIISQLDPDMQFFSGGLSSYNNNNGGFRDGIDFYSNAIGPPTLGKGQGIGDVEVLCGAAPIEIGNFVWNDADGDGIQDAGEMGIAGVDVQLFDPVTMMVVATATTDMNGNYIFSSGPGTTMMNGPFVYNLPLEFGDMYQLRIVGAEGSGQQGSLSGFEVTGSNSDMSANGDARDSDGTQADDSVISFTLGTAGQNDHTYDFGFAPVVCEIMATASQLTCDDNMTGSVSTDDTNTFNLDVTAMDNTSTMYTISVSPTATLSTATGTIGTPQDVTISGFTDGTTYTLTITDAGDPMCTTTVEVTPSSCSVPSVDLAIRKDVNNCVNSVGDQVTFTVTLVNEGMTAATNITVTDVLPAGLTYVNAGSVVGSVSQSGGIITWSNINLAATDTEVQLTVVAQIAAEGYFCNEVEITAVDGGDIDSTPGNDDPNEDDQACSCVGTPVIFCEDTENVEIPAQLGFMSYQWFVSTDGGTNYSPVPGGTMQTLTTNIPGLYLYTVNGGTLMDECDDQMCCPIELQSECAMCQFEATLGTVLCDANNNYQISIATTNSMDTSPLGYTVSIDGGIFITPTNGDYGTTNFNIFNAIPGTLYNITLTDRDDPMCQATVMFTAPVLPMAQVAEQVRCEDEFNSRQTIFDMSLLTDDINSNIPEGAYTGGGLTLSYHLSQNDADNDVNALTAAQAMSFENTVLGAQTVYARVEDDVTGCYSTTPVTLSVAGQPDADNEIIMLCEDPANPGTRSGVDLTSLNDAVGAGNTAGSYTVTWYTTMPFTAANEVPDATDVTVSDGQVLLAQIVFTAAPMCENVANVTVELNPTPAQMDTVEEVCEDGAGSATVNLTDYDTTVSGGVGANVSWYEDAAFGMSITDPTSVTINVADNGSEPNIFYAQIDDGVCMNTAQLTINVRMLPTVEAGEGKEICPTESVTLSDATLSAGITQAQWSITAQPAGGDGVLSSTALTTMPNTVTFTASTAGVYTLLLTSEDPMGPCDAVSDEVQVTVLPRPAAAFNPMNAEFCDGEDIPSLSVAVLSANLEVVWYQDPTATTQVMGATVTGANMEVITLSSSSTPAAPLMGMSTVVYAQTLNTDTDCVSEQLIPVMLTNNPLPAAPATPRPGIYCEGEDVPSIGVANPGNGFTVIWYDAATGGSLVSGALITGANGESITLNSSSVPAEPAVGGSVSIYAALVNDATTCESIERTEVTLTQNAVPSASAAELVECEDGFNSRRSTFDISVLTDDVNSNIPEGAYTGGGLTLSYHLSQSDADNDANALTAAEAMTFTNTTLGGQTLWVRVEDDATGCFSTAPITLSVAGQPDADDASLELCEDPTNPGMRSGVDLTTFNAIVGAGNTAGTYTVTWYMDMALSMAVPDETDMTVSDGQSLFAQIVFNTGEECENVATVTVDLGLAPAQMDETVQVCEDGTGSATVDLTDFNAVVSGGVGASVTWYEDAAFTMLITNPTNITLNAADNGNEPNIFYAEIDDGVCANTAQLTLEVSEELTIDAGEPKDICPEESVTLSDAIVSSGIQAQWSITAQPAGGDGMLSSTTLTGMPQDVTFTASVEGVYTLLLTTEDPQGPCTSVSDEVEVTILPRPAAAFNPIDAEFCDGDAVPSLSVNVSGTSIVVDWYVDPAGATPVASATITGANMEEITLTSASTPAAPTSGASAVVYAQTRNMITDCVSEELVAVTLTNNALPAAPVNPRSAAYCASQDIPSIGVADPGANFSIVWYDAATGGSVVSGATISGASGEDITLSNSSTPAAPVAGASVSVYAALVDNLTACEGTARTEVTLTQNPEPTAAPAEITECEDEFQSRTAEFDLTSVSDDINGGFPESGAVMGGAVTSSDGTLSMTFHAFTSDANTGNNPIVNPAAFTNTALGTQTVFVRIEDNQTSCFVVSQVQLSAAGLPDVDDLELTICPDLNSTDTRSNVNLTATEGSITAGNTTGTFEVNWFEDAGLMTAVSDPTNVTVTNGDDYYAQVIFTDENECENVGRLSYIVDPSPTISDLLLEFCEDEALQGVTANINLRDNDITVAGGISAIVNWYEDDMFTTLVTDPANVSANVADNGTEANIYYAQVSDGNCENRARVELEIFTQPVATVGGPYEVCAEESVILSGAILSGSATMGVWTISNSPAGGDGLVTPAGLIASPNTVTFTATVPGDYTLTLTTDDPDGPCPPDSEDVIVTVHPLPVATPIAAEVCVDDQVQVDGNATGGTTPYVAHSWVDMGTGTATGYTLSDTDMPIVNVDATGAVAGTVDLQYTVTDSNGCMDTDNVTVTVHPLPIPTAQDDMLCVGETLMLDGAPTGGTPAYVEHLWEVLSTSTATAYSLMNTDQQVLLIDATAATTADAGIIDLQYTVTDLNGCSNSITVTVNLNGLPEITVDNATITCDMPREAQLNATTTAASPSYMWTGPSITAGEDTANPIVDEPGTYTVIVTDGVTGCSNTGEVVVTQDPLSKCLPALFEIQPKPRQ
ncbi:MAG: SdrD B-like domain-containing protein [Bacteroidota bacterium]